MSDLRRARRTLLELRARLLGRATGRETAPIRGDEGDQAAASLALDVQHLDVERVRARVRQLEAAILRVDAGQYGLCAACGETISAKRLEAIPEAEHCASCAASFERATARGIDRRPAPYPADEESC